MQFDDRDVAGVDTCLLVHIPGGLRVTSVPTSDIALFFAKRSSASDCRVCAAMATLGVSPFARANSSEQITAAAAPQVGGQHCSRVSSPAIRGESSTSVKVTGSRNTAYGLFAAWLRALTATAAKVSALPPYFCKYSRPAAAKYCGVMGTSGSMS